MQCWDVFFRKTLWVSKISKTFGNLNLFLYTLEAALASQHDRAPTALRDAHFVNAMLWEFFKMYLEFCIYNNKNAAAEAVSREGIRCKVCYKHKQGEAEGPADDR